MLRDHRRATAVLAGGIAATLLLGGCGSPVVRGTLQAPEDAVGTVLAQRPCPGSDFRCITLAVPADHFATTSPLWEATFALHRGTVDSRGVLVTATGGPGSSGISEADSAMASMPQEITDHYDLVFFDQRGVGLTRPFRCDDALGATDAPTIDSSANGAARDAYATKTQAFVDACFTEAHVPKSDAPLYATRQAAEDLEVFRKWLGARSMILYGQSYGTQYQQTYAAAHPDRVTELLLDGPVDPGTDVQRFDAETASAYGAVLIATLAACDRDTACAHDAAGTTKGAYDRLAAELAKGPRGFAYPEPDGTRQERKLTLDDLRSAAGGSVSTPHTRTQFQRALNSATLGDDVPLARLADAGNGTDSSFSQALYFAVQCEDYDFVPPGASGRSQLDAWLGAAAKAGIDAMPLGDTFYGDLPCLFWPEHGAPAVRPAIGADPPYPVLLLTADTDPNTPTANADRLLGEIGGDVALVRLTGGPHVIYGRGVACVDHLVTRVITTGRLPGARVTVCPGQVSEPYKPVAPAEASGYDDAQRTVDVVLAAVLDDPLVEAWPGDEAMTLGCSAGGTARYSLNWLNTMRVDLHGCAWTPGVPVNGSVTAADGGSGHVQLAVHLPFATLNLSKTGKLTGTFRGRPVS